MKNLLYLVMLANLLLLVGCVSKDKVLLSTLNQHTAKLFKDLDTSRIKQIKVCDDEELNYLYDNSESHTYYRNYYWSVIDSLGINSISDDDSLIIMEQVLSGETVTYDAIVYRSDEVSSNGCSITIDLGSDYEHEILKNRIDIQTKAREFENSFPIIFTTYHKGQTNVYIICNNYKISVRNTHK